MHVTIIDSIYLSRIRNYIVGYQNVACGGCVGVAWGFWGGLRGGCGVSWLVFECGLGVWGIWGVDWARLRGEGVTAGVFGVFGVSVGCGLDAAAGCKCETD